MCEQSVGWNRRRETGWWVARLSLGGLMVLGVLAQGCAVPARQVAKPESAVADSAPSAVRAVGLPEATAEVSNDTTETADRLDYSLAHGGRPRRGETIYLLTIASEPSEAAARARLEEALMRFGEDGENFVVQRSENFEGMAPGTWIVVEAFSSGRNADSRRARAIRATTAPRVDRVVVRTDEPIPVYEERLEGP